MKAVVYHGKADLRVAELGVAMAHVMPSERPAERRAKEAGPGTAPDTAKDHQHRENGFPPDYGTLLRRAVRAIRAARLRSATKAT